MAVKVKFTREQVEANNYVCPKHDLDYEEHEEPEETYYTCAVCQVEAMKEMSTCDSCGATIKWATTPKGRKMPVDFKTTTARLENGEWVEVRISHFITCPNADEHRKKPEQKPDRKPGEAPGRRPPDAPPRVGAKEDKCKKCGMATDYSVSDQKPRRDGKPGFVIFENWPCPDGCGHWWKIKGSDYKPQWRDK